MEKNRPITLTVKYVDWFYMNYKLHMNYHMRPNYMWAPLMNYAKLMKFGWCGNKSTINPDWYQCWGCVLSIAGKYGHTIKQYSQSGKLLQMLGTPGIPGSNLNPLQFDQPAEVFISKNRDLYIVDGDGGLNNRLIKLDPGTYLLQLLREWLTFYLANIQ